MGLSNGVNDMYKEKLINYINNSPSINFIINVDGEFMCVEFNKENNEYFFLTTETKKDENNNFEKIGESYIEPLDSLDEDSCKIFVEKYESMILKDYFNNYENKV